MMHPSGELSIGSRASGRDRRCGHVSGTSTGAGAGGLPPMNQGAIGTLDVGICASERCGKELVPESNEGVSSLIGITDSHNGQLSGQSHDWVNLE